MEPDVEAAIRGKWDTGDFDGATTETLLAYGQEVFAFLVSRMRAEDRASDVFSEACEDLWRSMETFQWRCTMRTWLYQLARNAAVRYERTPANRRDRRLGLSKVSEIAERLRSRTLMHLRTAVKDDLRRIREQLDPEEQTLLILRIDRKLSWNEVAQIMAGEAELDAAELKKASARVRQQFQKLKTRLRDLARAEGLLDER